MASVFHEKHISYAIEKISEFINRRSASEAAVPGPVDAATQLGIDSVQALANIGCKIILDDLQAFEEKLRERHIPLNEREYHVDTALYAICELQSFIRGEDRRWWSM